MKRLVSVTVVVSVLTACAPAPSGLAPITDADRAAIKAVADSGSARVNAPPVDWAAYVAGYYADGAVVYPPNAPPVTGAAALAAFFAGFPPLANLVFEHDVVSGAGDLATVVGRYSFTMMPPGAPPVADSGKFIEVWARQPNGTWRSLHDMFNSSLPAPPPPPAAPAR